ncbi:MAG: hypothetical protein ACOX2G_12175 [Bacillota bacterium]|jgi:hypothetical protein
MKVGLGLVFGAGLGTLVAVLFFKGALAYGILAGAVLGLLAGLVLTNNKKSA